MDGSGACGVRLLPGDCAVNYFGTNEGGDGLWAVIPFPYCAPGGGVRLESWERFQTLRKRFRRTNWRGHRRVYVHTFALMIVLGSGQFSLGEPPVPVGVIAIDHQEDLDGPGRWKRAAR